MHLDWFCLTQYNFRPTEKLNKKNNLLKGRQNSICDIFGILLQLRLHLMSNLSNSLIQYICSNQDFNFHFLFYQKIRPKCRAYCLGNSQLVDIFEERRTTKPFWGNYFFFFLVNMMWHNRISLTYGTYQQTNGVIWTLAKQKYLRMCEIVYRKHVGRILTCLASKVERGIAKSSKNFLPNRHLLSIRKKKKTPTFGKQKKKKL